MSFLILNLEFDIFGMLKELWSYFELFKIEGL